MSLRGQYPQDHELESDKVSVERGGRPRSEPTITALWAAVNVLQQDVAELQREIFQEGEE